MSTSFSAPKGTYDLLPPTSGEFLAVVDALSRPATLAGYQYVQTPMFEDTALFKRSVGESTDVVSKEMYTFDDKGGRSLTLRPEGTAGVIRAVVEHNLLAGQLPVKLWYTGPNFRYEAPQSGRYRQHVQVGIEAIGVDDPALDAEVIAAAVAGYRALGLTQARLLLNSLGDAECRPVYRERLQEFLAGLEFDADTRRRAEINPLRVLDDKRPEVRAQLGDAPLMADNLCKSCGEHYDEVRGYLTAIGVQWEEAPRLVRGLDYYTKTTFEFQHDGLGAQSAIGGGGRYDGLVSSIGGPDLSGVGFGLGVDRTMLALKAEGITVADGARCAVYVVSLGAAKARAVPLVAELRAAGISADLAYGNRGLKGAMKAADRSGARYAIVVGERDLEAGTAQLKDLASGDQVTVALTDLVTTLQEKLPVTRTPYRTAQAGSLRAENADQSVTLAGWVARRRDHGGVIFIDLRDASGYVQVVFREGDMAEAAHALRAEYCVRVEGTVGRRPAGNENPDLPTGDVEVTATSLEVLSEAAPLPFPIDGQGAGEVGEEARLKYRYLDLRRSGPGAALRLRSKVNQVARDVLIQRDFVEIETPTLTRSTPEGARDFLVPVRLQPGNWYALPQSPQLFKQLLMVAGMERYFQIARCYRDEDFRADRQPEFTQLDIEISFAQQDDVISLGEAVLAAIWREVLGYEIPLPIPRMSYAEAMARFGSDRPDVRFGVELVDLTHYFAGSEFRVFQAEHVGAVVMPGGASQTRKELDAWQEWARSRGAKGLAYVLLDAETGEPRGPVAKNLSEAHLSGLADAVGAKPGDAVFFAAGGRTDALTLLGAARQEIGRRGGLIDESRWEFLWVVDFPMFEPDGDGGWTAIHHPFTAPTADWAETFAERPGEALSNAYDIVLNGVELGGGSVRIHRSDMQKRAFDVLGLSEEEASGKFGFLLEAFQYGPPPHAGIAIGWDRLCAVLSGSDSIRDVIAFPKTASGGDPLTGAPTPITAQQRKEAGIDGTPKA